MPSAQAGGRFTLCHVPAASARGLVVALHPFAEEMNKSRRMVAMGARAMAQAGFVVVVSDFAGCGDSDGDLETAAWGDWIDDALGAIAWGREQFGDLPLWIWGLRAGCLVACEAYTRLEGGCRLLFWQPQLQGKQALQQFLRLKMAGQLQQGTNKGATDALQRELAAGGVVEVSGYRLGAGIALGMAASQCAAPPRASATDVTWLEVSPQTPPALLPASEMAIERWRGAGHEVNALAVPGPLFWQSLDIEEAPALVPATVDALLHGLARATA